MKQKISKYQNVIISGVFAVFVYWLMVMNNGYMLRWYEEMSLFEPTRIFFRQFLYYPGGLLRYAGAWLTQLMYYTWLGSVIMIGMLLLLAWMQRKAFSLPPAASALSYLIPVALLVSVLQLDEALFSMKTVGYMFCNVLGCMATVGAVWCFRLMEDRWLLRLTLMIVLPVSYFIFGFYALLATILCVIPDVALGIREKNWLRIAESAIALVIVAAIPHIYYIYMPGNTVDNDFLYLKGLPELMMEDYDIYLWTPFVVVTAVAILLAILSAMKWKMKSRGWIYVCLAILLASGIWLAEAQKKSEQLRAMVLMVQSMENEDWRRMCGVMTLIKEEPNSTMQILYSIALNKLGKQPPFQMEKAPKMVDMRHNEKFVMTAFINVPVDYHMGNYNKSYRWCMEHSVQYGKKVYFLKYMVRDALMNGEPKLARRYNDMLMGTLFHRKWAEEMLPNIENEELKIEKEKSRIEN